MNIAPGKNQQKHITNGASIFTGADDQIRTGDLLITNQLLYRLSYIGTKRIQRLPFYLKGFFLSSF